MSIRRLAPLLVGLSFVAAAAGQDWSPEPGYTSLFNGKDLSGWVYGKGSAAEKLDGKTESSDKRFSVADGAIVANDGKGIRDLTSVATFSKSFHLKLQFRASAKSDSGVYVRGPQLQIRDFIRRGEHKQLAEVFKNDDWNELDITVAHDVITTTVNGKRVEAADVLELTVKDGKPLAKLNGQEVAVSSVEVRRGPAAECKINGVAFDGNYKPGPGPGPIGLQAETGKFEFRRIRIKELD